jgi:anhydro-N-acetylmuramic acid kinase
MCHGVFINMAEQKVYRAIGLMSGTALDGEIDVALLETDGASYVKPLAFYAHPYDLSVRDDVRACFGARERDGAVDRAEALVTNLHVAAVRESGFRADVIGFHGQTITHAPEDKFTWQIGDGARLAAETGMDVVADMRQADVQAGGQGAPLLPLYHVARLNEAHLPAVVLNIGGVANITHVDVLGYVQAFDCGPGNALMDDFMRLRTGADFDMDGALAASGFVHQGLVKKWLDHPHFAKHGAKSLDRNQWRVDGDGEMARSLADLNDGDGMATLMEFTARAIQQADINLVRDQAQWFACGGGRHNAGLMERLGRALPEGVKPVEVLGWNGDATEAEGFAYLAVRSLLDLPLTMPRTTGVAKAITGGVLHRA